jgi:phospholipid-binding lipoprotein MlaA
MRVLRQFLLGYLVLSIFTMGLSACGTPKYLYGDPTTAGTAKATSGKDRGRVAYDPYERFNRAMFKFNQKLDKYILKPLARVYRKIIPKPIRRGISNFFSNLREPISFLNNLLQGKIKRAFVTFMRFIINTVWGLYGLIDFATLFGFKKYKEDFGQTLAVWGSKGKKRSRYLVLPFFGPSTLRDGVGTAVDYYTHPLTHHEEKSTRDKLRFIEIIVVRESLLTASAILGEASTDPYIFMREAYYQRRYDEIHDGNPPEKGDGVDDDFLFGDDNAKKDKKPGNEKPTPGSTKGDGTKDGSGHKDDSKTKSEKE